MSARRRKLSLATLSAQVDALETKASALRTEIRTRFMAGERFPRPRGRPRKPPTCHQCGDSGSLNKDYQIFACPWCEAGEQWAAEQGKSA